MKLGVDFAVSSMSVRDECDSANETDTSVFWVCMYVSICPIRRENANVYMHGILPLELLK